MSLGLTLPAVSAVDWKPISLRVDWKNIFRTAPATLSPRPPRSAWQAGRLARRAGPASLKAAGDVLVQLAAQMDLLAQAALAIRAYPAVKIAAEALTLACLSIGLFSLFLGLSLI